jgi:hypothetical protein
MPGYILEKLGKAERCAKNLHAGKTDLPLGLNQEWTLFVGAIDSARTEAKSLIPKIKVLYQIKDIVEKGGEPVFTVKQIKQILNTID